MTFLKKNLAIKPTNLNTRFVRMIAKLCFFTVSWLLSLYIFGLLSFFLSMISLVVSYGFITITIIFKMIVNAFFTYIFTWTKKKLIDSLIINRNVYIIYVGLKVLKTQMIFVSMFYMDWSLKKRLTPYWKKSDKIHKLIHTTMTQYF